MSSEVVRDFESLLASKEIVVCCGSGGVGKTSIAAALAVAAATHLGGRVLVLTVDPARRLATSLGLGALGNAERQVPADVLKIAGLEPRGELWAAMLDTKQSWDALVLRHAPDQMTAHRILENRLYHNLTARFVQSHDYIAMERLYELHLLGRYDLIIVDTPPTRNAVDFLDAPQRMADFFGGRLLRLLTVPYRMGGSRGARVLNVATRPFYQIADRILGGKFLQEIAEFFLNFQSMYDGFVERAHSVEQLMRDRRTTFAVVTTLEAAPLHEAEIFIEELRRRRLHLGAVVLNRVLPSYFLGDDGRDAAATMADQAPLLARELDETVGREFGALRDPDRTARVLSTIAESFRNFAILAKREAELRVDLANAPDLVLQVPSRATDIADLDGLAWIGEHLLSQA